jgi:5-methylcytosine-specific restriction protein A
MTTRDRGRPWRRKRAAILAQSAGRCVSCLRAGIVTPAEEVDHVKPLSQGGTDDQDNLQALCKGCHSAKSAREASGGRKLDFTPDGRPVWPS